MRSAQDGFDRMAAFLAEEITRVSNRGIGDLQLKSNLAESKQSLTTDEAAQNLLGKAKRDLAAGRGERAASYIDRAIRLPFNELAAAPTGIFQAHMILFTTLSEALEESAEDDSAWLDAAEATLPQCGEYARKELLRILRVLDHDHHLAAAERRRIRVTARGARGDGPESIFHDRAEDDEATQRVVITELLQATTIFEAELDRRYATG